MRTVPVNQPDVNLEYRCFWAAWILILKERYNLNQSDIAHEIGVSRQMVSYWKQGRFLPNILLREKIYEMVQKHERIRLSEFLLQEKYPTLHSEISIKFFNKPR